ncbi:DnaT-like ssDNA-binding domain-containing protein [Thiocapsa bogorovii]|uniref:DnaT-like ssDNA-binding domain-containing protein n=1 Tax=Thiocapsa bogorovii TaxID=521689 RepID=UPI001E3DB115|nr:helix-turn-helix domain-containing protein [Thiocapsa bogorovii]UHD15031.1 helix-turn-helix domain-containing protein [Thiocapsa bogorovii]
MSRAARDWAWDCRGLTPAQRLVLLALAEHADEAGDCWPSLSRLAARAEVDRRTVTRCLAALEARGLIQRTRSRPQRTLYSLAVGASPAQAPIRDEETAWGSEPIPLDDGRAIVLDPLDPTGPNPRTGGDTPLDRGRQHPGDLSRSEASCPPNRHMNGHGTVSKSPSSRRDPGVSHDIPKRRPDPARPIPPDWGPGARVLSWAAKQGIARDWVQEQVQEFVAYWTDAGSHRTSWDATFIQRLQTLQARTTQRPPHEPTGRLADKDYARGATPLDRIPWLLPADVA